MLADGTYDAIVLEARDHPAGGVEIELAITAGDHKGEVVEMHAAGWTGDSIELLGVPASISVTDGKPSLRLEG